MTPLAPLVTNFFGIILRLEKGVSQHTIAKLQPRIQFLCQYVSDRLGKTIGACSRISMHA